MCTNELAETEINNQKQGRCKMTEKIEFFYKFYSMAVRDIETYGLRSSVVEYLERMWQDTKKWHEENDERVYRESLTLEQLYRLDH